MTTPRDVIADAAVELTREAAKDISRGNGWAWLTICWNVAILMGLAGVGYMLVPVARDFIHASSEATRSNTESFRKLSESMTTVHQAHASMLSSLEATTNATSAATAKIDMLMAAVEKMGEAITEARAVMRDVPQQRAEQTKLLEQIDEAIRQLSADLRKNQS